MNIITHTLLPLILITAATAQTPSYTIGGEACTGSNGEKPVISNTDLPQLGTTFRVNLEHAVPNATTFMTVGNSTTQWGPLQLPFEMSTLGAPSCHVYANGAVIFTTATNGAGQVSCPLSVPNRPALIGTKFFNQFVVLDQDANALGVVTTACGAGTIGS